MLTYCPSCGTNVSIEVATSGGKRQWRCPNCTLAFKEELLTPGAIAATPTPPPRPGRAPAFERIQTRPPMGRQATGNPPARPPPGEQALPWGDAAQARPNLPRPGAAAAAAAELAIPLASTPEEPFIIQARGETRTIATKVPAAATLATPPAPAPALPASAAPPAPPPSAPREPVSLDALLEPLPPNSVFPTVLIAEDSALLREVVKDSLVQYGVSREVQTCATGEDLLQAMAARFAANSRPDLVLIDVEMPVLNGYYTAIALRAFERGLRVAPTPVVFFTSRACDDTFRKVLEYCQPARYLNKGTDAAPPRVATRLVQVLASLRR